jgi:hypothetical protein
MDLARRASASGIGTVLPTCSNPPPTPKGTTDHPSGSPLDIKKPLPFGLGGRSLVVRKWFLGRCPRVMREAYYVFGRD